MSVSPDVFQHARVLGARLADELSSIFGSQSRRTSVRAAYNSRFR
jgi:hypothetical protein